MPRTPYQPYGTAVYRREVSAVIRNGVAVGEIIDDFHHFRAVVHHDGERITAVEGEAVRIPWTTCAGAIDPLQRLVGTPLEPDVRGPGRHTNWREQCTHWFDAASIAIARAGRGAGDVVYRVAVPDRVDGRTSVRLERDGESLLAWELRNTDIVSPEPFAGRSLMGLAHWVRAELDPELGEAVLVLQRASVISGGRLMDLEGLPRADAVQGGPMGSCHTYTEGIVEHGIRVPGTIRNLTHVDDVRRASTRPAE